MKHALLLSALSIALLSSCSTAFKAGQTPDDVYYSPAIERPEAEEIVKRDDNADRYITYLDDRYLRMKVANRYRWNAIDNFDYWYDSRYDFNTYNSYNYYSTVNPYAWNPGWNLTLGYGHSYYPGYNNWGWNSPVYTLVHYGTPSYGTTSGSNISAFRNKSYNNTNYGYRDTKTGAFVPSGSNTSFGNLLKRVFTPGSNNENASSYDRPARTYTPSTTNPSTPPATSSSAGGSSGGYGSTGSSSSSGRSGRGN